MAVDEELSMTCIKKKKKKKEMSTNKFYAVISKVFKFHSIRAVLIAKLKTESSQK